MLPGGDEKQQSAFSSQQSAIWPSRRRLKIAAGVQNMPEWHFFAFDSKAVSKALLTPAQEAVRKRDLPAWQQVYDKLNSCHYPPYKSGFSWEGTIIQNFAQHSELSRNEFPDESHPVLRKCLQTFVELVSSHHLQSRCMRVRTWVLDIIPWKKLLMSDDERAELELFNKEAW